MSIAKIISDQNTKVIESGGFHWKIKRVKSKDLMRAGIASLVHLAPDLSKLDGSESSEEDIAKAMQDGWVKKLSALSAVHNGVTDDSLDAIVCCGVVAASEDGEAWEKIRVTMKEKEHNPERSVVLVDSLPHAIRQELAAAIQTHSRDALGDADVVATFRKGA